MLEDLLQTFAAIWELLLHLHVQMPLAADCMCVSHRGHNNNSSMARVNLKKALGLLEAQHPTCETSRDSRQAEHRSREVLMEEETDNLIFFFPQASDCMAIC